MQQKIFKLQCSKASAKKQAIKYRVGLPALWVARMGLSKDDREIKVTFDGDKIIIEKYDYAKERILHGIADNPNGFLD